MLNVYRHMYAHIHSGLDILLQIEKKQNKHSAASNITKHLKLIMCGKDMINNGGGGEKHGLVSFIFASEANLSVLAGVFAACSKHTLLLADCHKVLSS